jgi:hypothetical protein
VAAFLVAAGAALAASPPGVPTYITGAPQPAASEGLTKVVEVRGADVAGNGRQDVIITRAGSKGQPGQVTVLIDRQGRYQESSATFFGGAMVAQPGHMVIADFNGDGILDVFIPSNALANTPHSPGVLLQSNKGLEDDSNAELPARSNAVQTAAAAPRIPARRSRWARAGLLPSARRAWPRSVEAGSPTTFSGSFPISWAGSAVPNAWEVTVDNWRQTGSTFNYYVVCATVKTVDNPSGL